MSQPLAFAEILDAVELLDEDAQAESMAVLARRLAERGRERVTESAVRARREFMDGRCRTMTASEILREASE